MGKSDRIVRAVLAGVTGLAALVALAGIVLVAGLHVALRPPELEDELRSDAFRAESTATVALQTEAIAAVATAAPGATELGTSVVDSCHLDAGFQAVRQYVACTRQVVRYLGLDGDPPRARREWSRALTAAGWGCAPDGEFQCEQPGEPRRAVGIVWAERPAPPPDTGARDLPAAGVPGAVTLTGQLVDEAALYRVAYGRHRSVVALIIRTPYYPPRR